MEKKGLKKFVKASAAVLLSAGMLFTGLLGYSYGKGQKYAKNEQAAEIVQELGADDTIVKKHQTGEYNILSNNGNEPIYVSFDSAFNNSKYEKVAKKSLDYFFEIVGAINSDYKYEIVEEHFADLQGFLGKTTIKYVETDFGEKYNLADGRQISKLNLIDKFSGANVHSQSIISFDFSKLDAIDNNDYIQYVFDHELLHAFGWEDVYSNYEENGIHKTARDKGGINLGSYIEPGYQSNDRQIVPRIITPNDYALFLSLYAGKFKDLNQKSQYIEKCKTKLNEYEEYYYDNFNDLMYEQLDRIDKYQAESPEGLKSIKFFQQYHDVDNTIYHHDYDVRINDDGTYTFTITDEKGNVLDQAKGKVIETDNFIFLENVALKKGLTPLIEEKSAEYMNGITESLAIFRSQNDGSIKLLVPHSRDIKYAVSAEFKNNDTAEVNK